MAVIPRKRRRLGQAIRRARVAKGWRQTELAFVWADVRRAKWLARAERGEASDEFLRTYRAVVARLPSHPRNRKPELCERLRTERRRRGYSREELAVHAGVSKMAVFRAENAKHVSIELLERLVELVRTLPSKARSQGRRRFARKDPPRTAAASAGPLVTHEIYQCGRLGARLSEAQCARNRSRAASLPAEVRHPCRACPGVRWRVEAGLEPRPVPIGQMVSESRLTG